MRISEAFPRVLALLSAFAAVPLAYAQQQVSSVLELEGRSLAVTSGEIGALLDVRITIAGRQRAIQDKALAAAHRKVNGRDARYVLALYELEIGRQRSDGILHAKALDALIASKATPAPKLPGYLGARGQIAYKANDLATARTLWTRLVEISPDDYNAVVNLAQVHQAENDAKTAADLLERAIAMRTAAGQPAPEALYRQWLSVANQGQLIGPGKAAAQALLDAYPTPANWRDALVVYRQLVTAEGDLEIDLLRLMRATDALARPAEYQRMAQLLVREGEPVEARAVLDEGISRAILTIVDSPTREISSEVDRAIAQRGTKMDPMLVPGTPKANTRLGMTLFAVGKHADAETAFRLAAASPRTETANYADLAGFWLSRIAQR